MHNVRVPHRLATVGVIWSTVRIQWWCRWQCWQ